MVKLMTVSFPLRSWGAFSLAVLTVIGIGMGLSACGGDTENRTNDEAVGESALPDTTTVSHVLRTDDRFSTLVAALDSTGLDSTLAAEGPYTLFAPTNDAFAALPDGTMEVLLGDRHDRLRMILSHHVVEERIPTSAVADSQQVTMMSGEALPLRATEEGVTIGEGRVIDGDIEVSNGLIHVINRVLPPPSELSEP